jgi:hypothetical protein
MGAKARTASNVAVMRYFNRGSSSSITQAVFAEAVREDVIKQNVSTRQPCDRILPGQNVGQ